MPNDRDNLEHLIRLFKDQIMILELGINYYDDGQYELAKKKLQMAVGAINRNFQNMGLGEIR